MPKTFGTWAQLLLALGMGPVIPPFASVIYPDITNNYSLLTSAAGFKSTLFHEGGHASHYSLVGETFWKPYRDHIVINDLAGNGVYGSFGNFAFGSDPDRVALGEALGYYIGNRYGGSFSGGENSAWVDSYIPAGLMFDLGDVSPTEMVTDPNPPITPLKTGLDNISGFTPTIIYGALTPNVNSIRNFRDRLRTLSIGATPNTPAAFNTFVDIYDVFQ